MAKTHTFEPGRVPCEAVFAPADTATNHGWPLTYVYDANTDRSDLVIIDIDRVADEPVAVVHLPRRVPYGFHGSWFPHTGDRDRVDQRHLAIARTRGWSRDHSRVATTMSGRALSPSTTWIHAPSSVKNVPVIPRSTL
jgi:hypothetical protein